MIKKSDKRVLITSALPYVNNIPHLGNIIGCVLSADVYARHSRLIGNETLYVCGSDEHGTATENKALEEGLTPCQICDKYNQIHKEIYDWFDISFDKFGRTSDQTQTERTQELFNHLDKNGFIVEEEVMQSYCEHEKKFLADRFIEGECPFCSYPKARGDQCDGCGKLLTPEELINPRCKTCSNNPVQKATKHLFLDLEKLQSELKSWVDKQSKIGNWRDNAIKTTNGWFAEGLKKRAITRDLSWGVKVPKPGYENKVFYVWFDAPIGYISITQQLLGDKWVDWWQKPDEVLLYQFMAKDNIPFHTILFPATLIGSRDNYTLLHHIDSTEYLMYEGGKFSKSNCTGVFGDDAKNTGLSSEIFRYYLLINRPELGDTNFSWEELGEKVNNELVANLGNFVNRTLSFTANYLEAKIEEKELGDDDKNFLEEINKKEKEIIELLNGCYLKDAFREIFSLSRLGNQYFQKNEPWKTRNTDIEKTKKTLFVLVSVVKDLGILLSAYLPRTSQKIFEQLNIETKNDYSNLGLLSIKNHNIGKPEILFSKIEDAKIKELKQKYSGKQETKKEEPDDFSKIDLRVAKIIEIQKHPDAEKLYIEKLDVGPDLGTRTIVSGIVPYYPENELLGKHIVIVANLKPAKLRGVESFGMLLAGDDEKGNVGIVLAPNSKAGDPVIAEGEKKSDVPQQIDIKEFQKINKLKAVDGRIYYENKKLMTSSEELSIDKVPNGKIR